MNYVIVIEKTRTGYSAYVPDVPGCVTVGNTRREIVKLMREALDLYFEEAAKRGDAPPKPTSTTALVEVKAPRAKPKSTRRALHLPAGVRTATAARYASRRHGDPGAARRRP